MPPASGRAQRKRGRARTRKDEVIEIRVTREVKALLNQAAKLAGQELADFVLASARRQAEEEAARIVPAQIRPEPKVPQPPPGGGPPEPAFRYRYLPDVAAPRTIQVSYIRTAPGLFPEVDPWTHPPGTNLLPTVFTNSFDVHGNELVRGHRASSPSRTQPRRCHGRRSSEARQRWHFTTSNQPPAESTG